ncbi:uncharacterized protein LOC110848627 isoform X2 [Folsomia candida]|nr:uncharacterized protein LOC110848627 isoform X2 [Folsomia candida]
MECYSLDGELTEEKAVILINYITEDVGQNINISLPSNFITITQDFKEALLSTCAINWTGSHMFVGIERILSPLIVEISAFTMGNSVDVTPTLSYWISPQKIDELTMQKQGNIQTKQLDVGHGVEFFMKNTPNAKSEERIRSMITNSVSIGAYKEGGIVVAAALLSHRGQVGPLLTAQDHRRNGYGLTCMIELLKEMKNQGFQGASSVVKDNVKSIRLHEKLGMTMTHESDWISHTRAE